MANLPVSETLTGTAVLLASTVFHWWNGRDKSRAYAQGAVDRAMTSALKGVSGQLERADARIQVIEDQHIKCETDLAEVRARLDESERDRAELRREIDRLMGGPVAGYQPKAPRS